jgi:DNA mismatch repair protein MutS2
MGGNEPQAGRGKKAPSLDSHTLSVLEFDEVLEMVRSRAPSSLGKEALSREIPDPDREVVLLRQRRTAQMRLLRENEADLSWGGSRDISPEVDRLQAEDAWVEPPSLLRIAAFAEGAQGVAGRLRSAENAVPDLHDTASAIADFRELTRPIRRCITSEGEVADSASPELGRIRRNLERVRRELVATLEGLFDRRETAEAVQEKIITRREGRYVVPVKAGSRTAVPGLVHDRSASGQTLYVEPAAVVEKNNALREMLAAEKEEVVRILRELGGLVRGRTSDLHGAMTAMAILEAVWARAVIAAEFDMVEPVIFEGEGRLELSGACHPLLREALGAAVVPMDFTLGGETRTLVLTGPNTGGKTVALKTIGLLCLMAQTGLQIPALQGSGMSCFREVLADIGDEQSIQQNLSTFSGHMKNIITVLDRSGPGSLVLLDELGAGTDPAEGAALGIAILEETLAQGALTIATTHHNAVKVFASSAESVVNASMEFDGETLSPTYRLVTGVPGRSQAFHIAARLGLPEKIIERAKRHQSGDEVRLDGLMADLEQGRRQLSTERASVGRILEKLDREEDVQRRKWEKKREQLEKGRRTIREAEKELAAGLRELKRSGSAAPEKKIKASMEKIDSVLKENAPEPAGPPVDTGSLAPGDRAFLGKLRAWGTVEEAAGEKITVTIGGKRFTVSRQDIEKKEKKNDSPRKEHRTAWGSYSIEVPVVESTEIDLRGMRGEEAVARLDRFIEHALVNNLPAISIIHGKGTGMLLRAVREYLAEHPRVESYGTAPLEQGGAGMTKARLSV